MIAKCELNILKYPLLNSPNKHSSDSRNEISIFHHISMLKLALCGERKMGELQFRGVERTPTAIPAFYVII
jgi:hypothetical protein